jgi:hypothetical protein
MNEPEKSDSNPSASNRAEQDGRNIQGPNLKLLYGIIALALAAAIAIASMIVLPFYRRR